MEPSEVFCLDVFDLPGWPHCRVTHRFPAVFLTQLWQRPITCRKTAFGVSRQQPEPSCRMFLSEYEHGPKQRHWRSALPCSDDSGRTIHPLDQPQLIEPAASPSCCESLGNHASDLCRGSAPGRQSRHDRAALPSMHGSTFAGLEFGYF